jgi:hypothetical protein
MVPLLVPVVALVKQILAGGGAPVLGAGSATNCQRIGAAVCRRLGIAVARESEVNLATVDPIPAGPSSIAGAGRRSGPRNPGPLSRSSGPAKLSWYLARSSLR